MVSSLPPSRKTSDKCVNSSGSDGFRELVKCSDPGSCFHGNRVFLSSFPPFVSGRIRTFSETKMQDSQVSLVYGIAVSLSLSIFLTLEYGLSDHGGFYLVGIVFFSNSVKK